MRFALEIGTYVYANYRPQMIGKIISKTRSSDGMNFDYEILWMDGRTTKEWHANPFESLIADHEKKLATHRANLAKAIAKLG